MRTKVARWGNSLALRIPKHLAETHRTSEEPDLETTEERGEIGIRPILSREYQISDLLEKVTTENLHREYLVDAPIGKEVW